MQIVDIPGGGLQGSRPGQGSPASSSFQSPAGSDDDADEPGEGVFRTFPRPKKSAKLASHSGSELLAESSPSTPAAQLEDSVEWVQLWERFAGKTYNWSRRTNSTVWQTPPGVKVVLIGERNEEEEGSGTGTGIRVFVRIPSLLFFLGEELYRQPRAVYKYWAGGLRSCYHAAASSSSSSSSTSL